MLRYYGIFFLLIAFQNSWCQKQASVWYFGHNAGINFSSGNPVVLTDGQLQTDEGVASIADANGNLLFYTEGTKIWNAQHQIMPNGQGLLGSFSSSQSAIIVPKINDPQRYYVFTVAQLGQPDGFNYNIVNMDLDAGRGDVEIKNVPIQSPVCEKVTAVKHCNGRDIWVIVHGWNSSTFHAYLVTLAGVSTTAVVSNTGFFVPSNDEHHAIGCLKASPDGKKLAIAHKRIGVDLLDFDNSTGIVSNGTSLFLPGEPYGTNNRGAYGIEFSPNSKFLYVSADYPSGINYHSIVLQYNVTLPGIAAIQASKNIIYEQPAHWWSENFGTLQTAPDGRMYMAALSQPAISVINFPNLEGTACGFHYNGLPTHHTNGGQSKYGLPSFIQSYFKSEFSFRGACSGTLLYFDYESASNELSVKWDFGDPASGTNNTSTLDSSQHLFTGEGLFTVKLIRFTSCGSDTVTKQVSVGAGIFELGRDTTLCDASQYLIVPQATGTNNTYLWQDGSSGSSFTATQDGLYWVEITNPLNACSKRDSVRVLFKSNPVFNLGTDLNKCEGEMINLSANIPQASYLWSTGSTSNSIQLNQSGVYWLQVSMGGCLKRDSINISYFSYPVVNLGSDTILCEGNTLVLDAKNPGLQYSWQNNSINQFFTVNKPGNYWVTVKNNVCISTDSIRVNYLDKPGFTLGKDTAICQEMTIQLQPKNVRGTGLNYLWSTGAVTSAITVSQEGNFSLTAINQCGIFSDAIKIDKGICKLYVPSAFTPNNDGRNDKLKVLFGENLAAFRFTIYDRWGNIVFNTTDIQKGWDGKYKGVMLDSGLFIWTIRYNSISDSHEKFLKGTAVLIR